MKPPQTAQQREADTAKLNGLQKAWLDVAHAFAQLGAVPLIAGLLALVAYLLLGTPQGPDLTNTVSVGTPYFAQDLIMLSLASLWLGGEAWFWSRRMVDDACPGGRSTWKPQWLLAWFPRFLGAAPFLIAALAFALNRGDTTVTAWLLAGLGVAFLVMLRVRTALLARAPGLTAHLNRLPDIIVIAGWVFAGATLAWVSFDPVRPARFVGAIGVVYFGVGMIIAVMSSLIHWGRSWRLPVLGAMILWAVILTGLGTWLQDNHAVGRRALLGRGYDIGGQPVATRRIFDDAFAAWYANAPVGPDGVNKPMIVVAAAGGASRAGYWAAEVLGHLQQVSHGRFADSVFAVSSVSGGSVGAAAFVSQLRDQPEPPKGFRNAVRSAAGGDYLSPALAGVLYPDLAQRFLPTIPVGGGKVIALPDRAEGLEKAFELTWAEHCADKVCQDPDLWTKPFTTLWAGSGPRVPLWFVNGAREEDGRRVLTAPVQITSDYFPDAVDFFVLTGGRDLSISSAIHNGARFPLVSPGGTLLGGDGRPRGHILDGGYFENSGVTTAGDIVRAATHIAALRGYKIRPILIELNNDSATRVDSPALYRGSKPQPPITLAQAQTHYFLADLLGPLGGITSSNDGRATPVSIAISREVGDDYLLIHLCDVDEHGKPSSRRAPMDWVLSDSAKKAMSWADELAHGRDYCGNRAAFGRILDALPKTRAVGAAAAPTALGAPPRR
ncbi:hypothetical protein [Phenylobacterium sp.]|uniref:hypothetical protein n=1 Tax=Phenylobacterium sp. TaxID=1871053 RepID=UPI002CBDD563|nr:hypothetical protein [Phenylobacterium sp.]HLZ75025.1 hypothetical protein [Phenylobacterium sp.]